MITAILSLPVNWEDFAEKVVLLKASEIKGNMIRTVSLAKNSDLVPVPPHLTPLASGLEVEQSSIISYWLEGGE